MNEENSIELINKELNGVAYGKEDIKNLIYTIRVKQVMLDSDVAMLYHNETKKINQAVKRNINRFPDRFCFKLTLEEFANLKSKFVTSSFEEKELNNMWSQTVTTSKVEDNKYRSTKYLPYVFTEQGIAMLSGLLRNKIAIQVSINIMDAFVEMRKIIANNFNINNRISTLEYQMIECNQKFEEVFNELQKNEEDTFKQRIFFNGQIYDAYSLIIDIIKTAQKKILIIDNYIDDSVLKMLSKKNKNVEVVILTSQNSNLRKLDKEKLNKQYPTLKIEYSNRFHDRFIIIDNKELYHCGASLKDLGKKCFAINKIEDVEYVEKMSKIG